MKLTKPQREAVKQMFGGRCAYCGVQLAGNWHADHVEPIYRRWMNESARYPELDSLSALFPACVPCNLDKTVMRLEAWRQSLMDRVNVCRRNDGAFRHAERFGRVVEVTGPLVFWFERYAKEPHE